MSSVVPRLIFALIYKVFLLFDNNKKINSNLLHLVSYLLKYRHFLADAVDCILVAVVSSSLVTYLLGKLTDLGFYDKAAWIVVAASVWLIVVSFLHGGSMFLSNYFLSHASQFLLQDLREELFAKILRWPAKAYQNRTPGEIASKFVNETNVTLFKAAKSAVILVRDTLQIVALSVMFIWHDVSLTTVTLLIAPLIIGLLRAISKKLKPLTAKSQENVATMLSRLRESYEAHAEVKITNAYDVEMKCFTAVNQEVKRLAVRATKISAVGTLATQLIGMAGGAVVLAVAMAEVQHGLMTMEGAGDGTR